MSMSAKIAAVEFQDRHVRVAVVRTGGKLPTVLETHHAEADYEDPEQRFDALVAAATHVAQQVKGPVSAWVLCAGSEFAVARTLRIPFKGRRKVAAVVSGELEPTLALPLEELVVDHTIVREIEGETEVLAVALRRNILQEQVDILQAAGVNVEGITIDVAALASLWRATRRPTGGLEALLHLDEHDGVFVVVHGKSLAWYRHVPVTTRSLRENPDRAVREVINSSRAFLANWEGEDQLQHLTVSGAPNDEELRATFTEGVPCPVSFEHLLDDVKGLDMSVESAPMPEPGVMGEDGDSFWAATPATGEVYAALVGAALSASGGAYAFNFMTPEFRAGTGGRSLVSHVVFSSILALLALGGYGAYCYADYTQNVRETERIGEAIWSLYQTSFPNSEFQERPPNDIGGRESFKLLEASVAEIGPGTELPVEWVTKPRLLEILEEISVYFADDAIRITNIRLVPGREPFLEVTGEVARASLDTYTQALEELKANSEVLTEPVGFLKSVGENMQFTIKSPY